MNRHSFLILLSIHIAAGVQLSYAQYGFLWSKVDTVTSGPYNDLNPAVVHNSMAYGSQEPLRAVFERHTPGESQIVAKNFRRDPATWDSSVVVISSGPAVEEQIYPDYSETAYYANGSSPHVMRMAAWQRWKENSWQLYYSTLNDSALSWSTPALLVPDAFDNTGVQIRPFRDSLFIVTWKRGSRVMGLFKTPSTTSLAETLAFSNLNPLSYDVLTRYDQATIIWTVGVENEELAVFRKLSSFPPFTRTEPETLRAAGPCHNPHLAMSYFGDPSFVYERQEGGRRQVFEWLNLYSSFNVSDDTLSDNLNARAYAPPVITKAASTSGISNAGYNETVYEKYRMGDSMLVFLHGFEADTVRTPGHNRNACIGSQDVFTQTGGYVLAVWESNRSGISHIYSRLIPFFIDAVDERPHQPLVFALRQNYPNPFNPRTTIDYRITSGGPVRLQVFDILGREVALLVNEPRGPGSYSVTFDGSRLASGVYIYRLAAGNFWQVRTMALVK